MWSLFLLIILVGLLTILCSPPLKDQKWTAKTSSEKSPVSSKANKGKHIPNSSKPTLKNEERKKVKECEWTAKILSEKSPVFLNVTRDKLYIPNSSKTKLREGESLRAACTGKNNVFSRSVANNERIVHVECVTGTKVKVLGKTVDIKALSCVDPVSSVTRNLNEKCANQGKVTYVSLEIKKEVYVDVYSICYDVTLCTPIYAQHKVYGKAIEGRLRGETKKRFRDNTVPECAVSKYYEDKKKQDTPTDRGHLAPTKDFIFNYLQHTTFEYSNVVPQCAQCNRQNWLQVETSVRNLANNLGETLDIYTGVYDIRLVNDQPIYLGPDKVPMPKYIWKIVCDPRKSCIAIIVKNVPQNERNTENDLCTDICKDYMWDTDHTSIRFVKDDTFCCNVQELYLKLGYKVVNAVSVLSYTGKERSKPSHPRVAAPLPTKKRQRGS